jgi:hypothetical protein
MVLAGVLGLVVAGAVVAAPARALVAAAAVVLSGWLVSAVTLRLASRPAVRPAAPF